MTIRLMLFDLWGTLILNDPIQNEERRQMRVRMAADALTSLGHRYDDTHAERAFDAAGDELSRVHADGLDLSTEGRTVLYLRHLDPNLGELLDDEAWSAMHKAVLTVALVVRPIAIPGAAKVLAEVKALGLQVGLISNAGLTPGFVLRQILDGHGLLQYFDDTIFSDEVELSKPSAAIFERALDAFGVEAAEAAFIGDQPILDVLGPQGAGIWSVQLGDLQEDGIEPHARIETLGALVPALRSLGLV